VNTTLFLDEFRPFRRGEIALARKRIQDPFFLPPGDLDVLRYAVRLAQMSSVGSGERDVLLTCIGNFRLRLLQLLAPVLPTDPRRIDAEKLDRRVEKVVWLVDEARNEILKRRLVGEAELDAEVADKKLALVLGGAAGSGYVFLGALQRLERAGRSPDYLAGCSVGAILAVIRARTAKFDLQELLEDVKRMRERGVFRPPTADARFGIPSALRLDLRGALGDLFATPGGRQRTLREMELPVDVLAAGLGPGAFSRAREPYARLVDADLRDARSLAELRGGPLARVVSDLVSLAMSRRVLEPLYLGADAATAELPALDAAGFSASIPSLLQVHVPPEDEAATRILEGLFERHQLSGIVDGALTSLIPARYAWEALESGRIGSRNYTLVALDALAAPRGANALLAPLFRVTAATSERDRPFWDLHVAFRNAPPFLDLFPTESRLRQAAERGRRDFGPTHELLEALRAPLRPWGELLRRRPAPAHR